VSAADELAVDESATRRMYFRHGVLVGIAVSLLAAVLAQ
jgi:hypothetical protein